MRCPAAYYGQRKVKRRGVSLLELTISLVSAGVLVAGLSSSILIALRACDPESSPTLPLLDAATALTELQTDLQCAKAITEKQPRSVTVLVPDRDGDGQPETIRYAWTGISGMPLTRRVNSGAILTFSGNVADFALEYEVQTLTRAGPPTVTQSGVTTLSGNTSNSLFSDQWTVTATSPGGQYFEPSLPANARDWKVTEVRVRAVRGDTPYSDTTYVQLRPADSNGLPTLNLVESQPLLESHLTSSLAWYGISFQGTSGLLPAQRLCLTLAATSTYGASRLHYRTLGLDGGMLKGNGTLWSRELLQTLSYEIRGTVTTSTPTTVNVPVVTGVRIRWRPQGPHTQTIYSAVAMLNLPPNT